MKKVVVRNEVLLFIDELVAKLVEEEYFGFLESSLAYVNNLYDFIQTDLPETIHYKTPTALKKYGRYYVKLKSNKQTTWYIFFDKLDNLFLVKFITNNHAPQSAFLAPL